MMRALFTVCLGLLVLALVASGTNLWFSSEDANALESPLSFHPSQTGARIEALPEEKVLVIAMSSDIQTMDPAKTSAMYGPPGMIYETLIQRDLTGAYVPGLAESWNLNTTVPDHPTFEMRLKQGVRFHDGLAFDTHAVKRILNYYVDNNSWVQYEFWAIYGSQNKTGWPNAGIWCKDSYNMSLNLTWTDVALVFNLSHLYGSMMSPNALESDGLDHYGTPGHLVVGTGPFMLQEWIPGDHVTLVKNTDYNWGASWYVNKGPATIDRIIYRIITDQTARFAGFESGDIDVLQGVPPNKVLTYAANSEMTVVTGPGQGTYHMEFNCQKAPWTNVSLRKAFGFAIDRTQIVDSVWHGYAEPGVNYLPPIEPEGRLIPSQYNFSYDVARSEALFLQAGYRDTDSDNWLENTTTGTELTLNLWTTNKGEDVQMAEILQTQFQAVGVHIILRQYAETQLRDEAAAGNQEAILFWYSWPRAEILDWHFGTWAAGGSNTAWYTDPVFDEYVANWTVAETEQAFTDNATAAHERLLDQAPWAPIIYWHQIDAIHNNVTGWYVHPIGREQVFNILDVDVSTPPPPVDTVAPSTTVDISGTLGLNDWYTSPVTITLEASDDTSGVASTFYKFDDHDWLVYSDSFLMTAEGVHILWFYSTDSAGNTEVSQFIYLKIDTMAPATTATLTAPLGANGWYIGPSVSVELVSGDYASYVTSVSYRVDNGTWQTYSSKLTIDRPGSTVIDYYASDAAGNIETQKSVPFKLDTETPVIAVTYPPPDSKISEDTVTIEWSGADYCSGIDYYEVQVDGGNPIPMGTATSYELKGLQDGWHSITVYAVDNSGQSASSTVSFGIYTSIWSQNGPYNGIPLYALIAGIVAIVALSLFLWYRKGKSSPQEPVSEDAPKVE
jgi:peptide/nickel transport system substrate-binding protein